MPDDFQAMDNATLSLALANAYQVIPEPTLLEDTNRVFPLLSRYHWTAWENEPGDYTIVIRGRRMGFRGAFARAAAMGRADSFARAAVLALLRKHRMDIGA